MDVQHSLPDGAVEVEKERGGSKRRRWIVWGAAAFVVLLVVALGYMWCRMNYVPSDLDYSTVRLTEQGLYEVGYTLDRNPIPVNQMHTWTLHVETAAGEPVEDAQIMVDGDMPQHGHGLPTQPMVTDNLGNGDYLVDGIKFHMSGWWVMDFTIHSGDQSDLVRFNLLVD